jgi:hypothetical protein
MKSDTWESGKKYVVGTPSNLGLILEHITSLAEFRIVSIYVTWVIFGLLAGGYYGLRMAIRF